MFANLRCQCDSLVRLTFIVMTAMFAIGCSVQPEHNGRIVFGATETSPGFSMAVPENTRRISTKFGRCRFTVARSGIDLRPSVANAEPNMAADVECEITVIEDITINEWKNDYAAHFRIDTPDGSLYAVVSGPTTEVLDKLRPCFASVKLDDSNAD